MIVPQHVHKGKCSTPRLESCRRALNAERDINQHSASFVLSGGHGLLVIQKMFDSVEQGQLGAVEEGKRLDKEAKFQKEK